MKCVAAGMNMNVSCRQVVFVAIFFLCIYMVVQIEENQEIRVGRKRTY